MSVLPSAPGLRSCWQAALCRMAAGSLLLLAGCGKVELYSQLKEREANEMAAILDSRGIAATKATGADQTFTLSVSQTDFAEAVDLLHTRGYPKDQFVTIGEVFKQSGMVSSPTEDRVRFIYALSQSLSETLTRIDGVVTARVHVVLPDNNPLAEKIYPSSAAVFIKYQPNSRVEELRPQIKQLVANSIEGLAYDKVSLVLVPAYQLEPLSAVLPKAADLPFWLLVGGCFVAAAAFLGIYLWLAWFRPAAKPAAGEKTKA